MVSLSLVLGILLVVIGFILLGNGVEPGVCIMMFVFGSPFILYIVLKALHIPKRAYSGYSKSGKPQVIISGTSIYGLPQGETKCVVSVYDDCISFVTGKQTSKLSMKKISSAYAKSKKELTGAKTGSIVAGAMFFGAIGALVAARPKTSEDYILIVNYTDDGEPKAIAVAADRINKINCLTAERIINKRASKLQTTKEINL